LETRQRKSKRLLPQPVIDAWSIAGYYVSVVIYIAPSIPQKRDTYITFSSMFLNGV